MRKVVALGLLVLSVLVVGLVINSYFNESNSSFNSPSSKIPAVAIETQPPANPEPSPTFVTPSTPPAGSIIVPDNFSTISQAIANASDGQTIFVRKGYYNESVTVDKSLWLIGENQTLIDAHSVGVDILISHNNVNVTGFTLQNTPAPATGSWLEQMQGIGISKQLADIQIINSQYCNIYANNLTNSIAAVHLENASQNTIINNNILGNSKGVDIDRSTNNCIQNNFFMGGGTAVSLKNAASNNSILNNTVTNANYAIYLDSAYGNTLRNNKLTHNLRGFGVTGNTISAFVNMVDASNTIDGKPIYYLVGKSNGIVPSDAGCVVLVNNVNMAVQNATLPLGSQEIVLVNTNNSVVKANTVANTDTVLLNANYMPQPPLHIFLYSCFNNDLINNQGTILLNYSSSNRLTGNTGAMHLYRSDNNKIVANNLTPVLFDVSEWNGVTLDASSNNLIKQNTISENAAGISVENGASNNMIIGNNINGNHQGGIVVHSNASDLFGSSGTFDPTIPSFNTIFGNNVTRNGNEGILDCGYNTQIVGNTFTKNGNCGVQLTNSQNTTITGNVIDGFFFGLMGNSTRNVMVVANNITINNAYSPYCVWLLTAYPATFYHNNFLGPINFSHFADNYKNSTVSDAVNCVWDNGSQGNYWIAYNGTDVNGDGVGDTPYSIGFGYYDNYPLMTPYDITQAIPPTPP